MVASLPITGECFCGGVRYQVDGHLREARCCHCSRCRKVFGSAASAYARVDSECFTWLAGEELLSAYSGQSGFGLMFCKNCGSTLCGLYKGTIHGVTLGCVNGDPGIAIEMHLHVDSKAPWDILPRGARLYPAGPPD